MLAGYRLRGWALALLLGLLAACGEATTSPRPTTRPSTTAAATTQAVIVAVSTDTPAPASPRPPTDTPAPPTEAPVIPSATASDIPSATPTPPCTNDAEFVSDLTVPDGTQFLAGQPIGKQWAIRNNGTCDWNADYRLVLVSGNALGARSELALYPARAGANAVIEVAMFAPAEPGTYTGRWQGRDPDGSLFGDRIFITIEVVAPVPPTETPAP